jgi:hypothetical protein
MIAVLRSSNIAVCEMTAAVLAIQLEKSIEIRDRVR